MKNKMNNYMLLRKSFQTIIFLGCMSITLPTAIAQQAINTKEPVNRWAVGGKISHFYDVLFTGYDLLNNGFSGEDLHGLNGSKTKFDIGLGLDVVYFWTPLISVDLAYDFGKMTGANSVDYYESDVSFLQMGVNFDLKTKYRSQPYKWVPYLRASLGRGTYDTKRKFIEDDGIFNTEAGAVLVTGLGGGLRYHFNNNWHALLQSEYSIASSDAWDGYNYGTGKEHMIRTSLGIRYSFGKHAHEDRGLAWQGGNGGKNYDKEVAALRDSLQLERQNLAKANSNISAIQTMLSKDSDGDGMPDIKDHCPQLAAKTINGCPEEIKNTAPSSNSTNNVAVTGSVKNMQPEVKKAKENESYNIYFDVNSTELKNEGILTINKAVKFLKENPEILASVIGFADYSGSDTYNYNISLQRAQVVYNYLVKSGIAKERLQTISFGKQPKQDLDYLNRKVEIFIE